MNMKLENGLKKRIVTCDDAPEALGPYSQAVEYNDLVFLSGQLGIDPDTGELEDGIEGQTLRAIENLTAVLIAAGSDLDKVIKTTIFLSDLNDFGKVNEIYASYFEKEPPARATVEVARLPKDGLVEISMIAHK